MEDKPSSGNLLNVRLMFSASQTQWIERSVTVKQYMDMFLTGTHDGLALVYIWPHTMNVMYDCHHRQWMVVTNVTEVSEKFLRAGMAMTKADSARVHKLIQRCMEFKK